jgi:hypothetical protein
MFCEWPSLPTTPIISDASVSSAPTGGIINTLIGKTGAGKSRDLQISGSRGSRSSGATQCKIGKSAHHSGSGLPPKTVANIITATCDSDAGVHPAHWDR